MSTFSAIPVSSPESTKKPNSSDFPRIIPAFPDRDGYAIADDDNPHTCDSNGRRQRTSTAGVVLL